MKAVTPHNNFARAKLDHDVQGRFDLPIFQSGADAFENWISNFKGNAIYRTGWEAMVGFQDCALIEFKFSNNQNYILVLYNTKMRFLSYDSNGVFGWVLDGGASILEIDTPWNLAESKEIARSKKAVTQNFDTMILVHKDHEPRRLTRVSATSFTLLKYARKDDPFPLTFQATKNITGATQATNCNLTIVGHGYSVGDRIKIASITGMTQLNGWTATVLTVPGVDNVTIDVDTTGFTAYSSGGTAAKVLTGDYPMNALFSKGRLSYGGTRLRTTTLFQSESGFFYIHTLPSSVTDASALQYTIAEIAQPIDWMIQGSNSLIIGAADGVVAINGGGVGEPITSATIEATITPADGCNTAEPLKKDGNIFYVGQNGRNVYYFKYDILTEEFLATDANVASYDISKTGFSKIRYTKDRNNLVHALRGDNDWCTMNFSEALNVVGWHEHSLGGSGALQDIAQISDNDGNPQIFALNAYDGVYYIERQASYIEFKRRDEFYTVPADNSRAAEEAADALDSAAFNRYLAEQLKSCIYLDNSTVFSDLRDTAITYDSGAGTITDAGAGFVSGDVGKHIVYKTATGYESGRFLITAYTSSSVVEVDVLQTPTANTYSSWYLTFNTLTGLSRFNGIEVAVVAEGGYLNDYEASSGTITLPDQVTHAVAGYKYRGIIKSFPLGFQIQGQNTQTTMKAVSRAGVRAVASAGGKFGTSPYHLEPVQELGQTDINYLPPLPIDGTKYISYSDDNTRDKHFYLVQDEPLPFTACGVFIEANYAVRT